jgi:cyanobactin maturation PatA/PatG family protease
MAGQPEDLIGIHAALASAGTGSASVTVGIVDGLPDLHHPVLRGASIEILEAMVPPDSGGPDAHGTGVSSIIFGQNDPVRGLVPSCHGLALPIFFRKAAQSESRPVSQLDLARAITFGLERGVSIINISAGQKSATAAPDSHLEQALQTAIDRRVLLIAAAGNDGCACIHLPAAVESVLSVGALGQTGRPLETSNWAEPYRRNGLLAPGEGLPVATLDGGVTTGSGTSYATAVVSGVAALLLSVAREEGCRLDALDIRQILLESAATCDLEGEGACDRYLAGTLDAAAALVMVRRAGSTRHSFATLRSSALTAPVPDIGGLQHITRLGMGSAQMSSSGSSDTAAIAPSGLSPSACTCQQKPDDDTATAKVEPQSAGSPPPATSPIAAMAQSSDAGPIVAPPLVPMTQSGPAPGGITQLACSCGGGQPPQIVYALGALWFDFGTEARYDAIVQQLDPIRANNPAELVAFLRANPQYVTGISFILMQEQIPLYAIQPAGPFALQVYTAMFDAVESSLDEKRNREQRVSIPGVISGSIRLLNGMTVPVIYPDLRGMYKWQSHELIAAAKAAVGSSVASDDHIFNFLNRVYYELRNFGVAPQDRALNFAATNAYQTQVAFAESAGRNLELDTINVVKSPICRPDSDCWDVELQMFDPENERRANRVYRYTVDVSEVLPVTVGSVRTWAVRA